MSTELRTESGAPLHPIGIGTYPMGSQQDALSREISPDYRDDNRNIAALAYSLRCGQNHIDTAELYGRGHTEELVGLALRASGIRREDVFVATKLWKDPDGTPRTPAETKVEAMLDRLNTDYIDLLYIHTTKWKTPWREWLPPMNRLVDQGIVRHIGVSEFDVPLLQEAQSLSDHPIDALQLEYSVGKPDAITPQLREYCQDNDIQLVAYSPLGKGAQGGTLNHPEVVSIANRHRVSPGQVALAWCIARDTLPIPKAGSQKHIDDNLEAASLRLNRRELRRLES